MKSIFTPLAHKDLLSIAQLSSREMEMILSTATEIKARPTTVRRALEGKTIVLLFEKESLRTLATFEIGMARLGGQAMFIDHKTIRIGEREPIVDYAKNLERWTDAIVARTYEHSTIQTLAAHSRVPVVNALSNLSHPCQTLGDYLTLMEKFGDVRGLRIAYIGDGNNVCHSLMLGAAKLGSHITVISPKGYEPLPAYIQQAELFAAASGGSVAITNEVNAIENHRAIYTDTWISMGSEAERDQRLALFAPYQVTPKVMQMAGPSSVFMHCLPAHRGEEVAAEVIDSPSSIVYDQAENRMHAQNALLLHLLGGTIPRAVVRNKKRVAVSV